MHCHDFHSGFHDFHLVFFHFIFDIFFFSYFLFFLKAPSSVSASAVACGHQQQPVGSFCSSTFCWTGTPRICNRGLFAKGTQSQKLRQPVQRQGKGRKKSVSVSPLVPFSVELSTFLFFSCLQGGIGNQRTGRSIPTTMEGIAL